MKLITFGLGGAVANFLRLGFGSTAKAAESRVNGGVLRGQFRPVIFNRPILLDVTECSRVSVRVRFTSTSTFEASNRGSNVQRMVPPRVRVGAGGYLAGSRGESAFHELQRTLAALNCMGKFLAHLRREDRMLTENDKRLLGDSSEFLRRTMSRYRVLTDALAEPRHIAVEVREFEQMMRSARDEQDLRDVLSIVEFIDRDDRMQKVA